MAIRMHLRYSVMRAVSRFLLTALRYVLYCFLAYSFLSTALQNEVDLDIAECANDGTPNDIVAPYGELIASSFATTNLTAFIAGKLSVARTAVLKHTLRSVHRMMQSSGTSETSEGLRGLLDSSLLSSIKKVMQHRAVFGPSALALGGSRVFRM